MNKYDTEHVTTGHPLMSDAEFLDTYRQAWHAYYTPEHMETIMRRAAVSGMKLRKLARLAVYFYGAPTIEHVHPLQFGLFRRKYRKDRRLGLPTENALVFYPRYLWEIISKYIRLARLALMYKRIQRRVERDPARHEYQDLAITPASDEEQDTLELFNATEAAKSAVEKYRRNRASRILKVAAE